MRNHRSQQMCHIDACLALRLLHPVEKYVAILANSTFPKKRHAEN